ncbi:transcription antitermination factor NusB [Halobacteriovorax sp. GB3]|uniref:transcription antitermination factor NusB n=1 Tax=Halobacteriovorax sp. GB3 TaxID=2719615 RepID=UPI0023619C36|nr:transcription antitermination factor NusB [Halobacteriovorax sp. GB3]MDD0853969.1 transcription antitermination factor NusB [Halobacteriovorax sp. GB3]
MTSFSNKTVARDYAFKFLYKHQLNEFSDLRETLLKSKEAFTLAVDEFDISYVERDKEHPQNDLTPNAKNYGVRLIAGVLENLPELQEIIKPKLKRSFNSLEKVDATILLVAIFEMKDISETPYKVTINEAIEMAKKYGTAEAARFVNAILDKVSKEL